MKLQKLDKEVLTSLEQALWDHSLQFEFNELNCAHSAKFIEVDRLGQQHERSEAFIARKRAGITQVELPLPNYSVELISPDTALATYHNEVRYRGELELSRRLSLWVQANGRWQLQLHQATII